jgi:hypothetical protein
MRQVLDEGAVDLQHRDREALQVGQRGIAGAEIVDRDARARSAILPRMASACAGSTISVPSVISSTSLLARQAGKRQRVVQHFEEAVVAELARADVDRDVQLALGDFLELAQLHAGRLQRPGAEQVDQAIGFGDRDEAHRRHHAQGRVLPAHQGLEAFDLARARV